MTDNITPRAMAHSLQPVSRRQFVKTLGIGLASSILLAGTSQARLITGTTTVNGSTPPLLPTQLMRSSFLPHIGESFLIQSGMLAALDLYLTEVLDLHMHAQQASAPSAFEREQSFILRFRGPQDQVLPQGTYPFEHSQLGSFSIFVVPMEFDAAGRYYEAVFYRQ